MLVEGTGVADDVGHPVACKPKVASVVPCAVNDEPKVGAAVAGVDADIAPTTAGVLLDVNVQVELAVCAFTLTANAVSANTKKAANILVAAFFILKTLFVIHVVVLFTAGKDVLMAE